MFQLKLAGVPLPLLLLIGLASLMIAPTVPASRTSGSAGDFSLSASPSSFTVSQGAKSWSTLTVSGIGGYQGNVSLSVAETYDSIDIFVQPKPSFVLVSAANPSATSNLTISVSTFTTPGTYSIAVVAFDGSFPHQTQISLQVTGKDFKMTANPNRLTFPAGMSNTFSSTIEVTSLGGFSGNVNLTLSWTSQQHGVPLPMASHIPFAVPVTPSAPGVFRLDVSVNSSILPGPYSADITGVGRTTTGNVRGCSVGVTVGPDFNTSMSSKNLIVHQGGITIQTAKFTSLNGLVGGVMLEVASISVLPPNPSIETVPSYPLLSAGGTNDTRLIVKADSQTGLGTYSLFLEGGVVDQMGLEVGGGLPFNLTVVGPSTAPPDFTMYADPARIQSSIGASVSSTINLYGLNGFTGPVSLFADYGTGASLSSESVTLQSHLNATSRLTINLPGPGGEGGGYTPWWFASGGDAIMVIATDSAGYSQVTWVNATATPFTVAANPTEQQLLPNSTAKYSITVSGIGNFNDTVRLSTVGSSSIGAILSNRLLNFSGMPSSLGADLTVSVPAGTVAGTYVVQVTGTYLRPEYVCACAPRVALNYTIPLFVTVLSTSVGGAQFFGIPIITFYEIVGAIGAGVVVAGMYLVLRGRKTVSGLSSGPNKENKL